MKLIITNIPFVVVFKHSLKSREEVDGIIVELTTENGITGYGEALPRDYVTGETTASVSNNLINHIFPKMRGMKFESFDNLLSFLDNFHETFPQLSEYDLCVKAAVELALLDAYGKENKKSVLELFATPFEITPRPTITYSGIISAEQPAVVAKILEQYKKIGIKQIKLKVGKDLETDIKNIKLAQEIIGEGVEIRVDANEAWNLETAMRNLACFSDLKVVCVEQPMPKSSRDDYPTLLNFLKGKMDLSIDEGLCTIEDAKWMIENGGASVFNLRISKNGGLSNALKIYTMAKTNGIKCQLGAQVGETSILSSTGRILASLCGKFIFHEGSFGTNLLAYDLTSTPLAFGKNGIGDISYLENRAGLAVEINPQLLAKMTKQTLE